MISWDLDFIKIHLSNPLCRLALLDENENKNINSKSAVMLKCECGYEFKTSVEKLDHRSSLSINECGICSGKNLKSIELIRKYTERNSSCKLLSDEYLGSEQKLKFECSCGNHFETRIDRFIKMRRGKGKRQCDECGLKIRSSSKSLSQNDFLKKMTEQVGDEYKVLEEYVSMKDNILMRHNSCGNIWSVAPANFLYQKTRCPNCYNSNGENSVKETLDKMNIQYVQEYSFEECKDNKPLRFDFYLPEHNTCVEYDGVQHFQPVGFGEKNESKIIKKFHTTRKRDRIKDRFCKDNNINLIRIPYWEYKNVEELLKLAI